MHDAGFVDFEAVVDADVGFDSDTDDDADGDDRTHEQRVYGECAFLVAEMIAEFAECVRMHLYVLFVHLGDLWVVRFGENLLLLWLLLLMM